MTEPEHVKLKKRSRAEIYLDLCEQRLKAASNKKYNEVDAIDARLDKVRLKITEEDGEEINRLLKEYAEKANGNSN